MMRKLLFITLSVMMLGNFAYANVWVHYDGHRIPAGAVVVHYSFHHEPLYRCRGYLTVHDKYVYGILHPSTGYCQSGEHRIQSEIEVLVQHSDPDYECLMGARGQVCGYHCLQTAWGTKCAIHPTQMCLSNKNGYIACGFNCITTSDGVVCARHPGDQCAQNREGEVRCGRDCHLEFGRIVCGGDS